MMIVWHSSFNILKELFFLEKEEKRIGSRMFVKYYSDEKIKCDYKQQTAKGTGDLLIFLYYDVLCCF